MSTQLIQFSSVVVGRAHNPSILNPDFLRVNDIVPKDWDWEVAETITTPPMALVRYANGVAITVEHNKLQVVDVGDEPRPTTSKVGRIARKYVETLPHVPYVAAGNNFLSALRMENPGELLKSRFLRAGKWDTGTPTPTEVGLRLVYPVVGGSLVLSLDAGQAEKMDDSGQAVASVVLVNGNFHRDCVGNPTKEQIMRFLELAGEDFETYQEVVARVLE